MAMSGKELIQAYNSGAWHKQFKVTLAAAAGITDTSTANISNLQGKQWDARVAQFGESLRVSDQFVMVRNELVGNGDKTLAIPKTTSSLSASFDFSPSGGEGDVADNTELSNLTTVDITVDAANFHRGKVSIANQILQTSRVNLLEQARFAATNAIAQKVDSDLNTTLQDASAGEILTGGATGVSGLATGDILTTDAFADGIQAIEANNFVPRFFLMGTPQKQAYLKDSQFVNASEFGSDAVIQRGQISRYLGVDIFVSTQAPAYTSGQTDVQDTAETWGAAGHASIMVGVSKMGEKIAGALVWKQMPAISSIYEPDEDVFKVFAKMAYNDAVIQPGAIAIVKSTDA